MRQFQDIYFKFGEVPISEIKIDMDSRDDIPQILIGLKSIYEDKTSLNKIIEILKKLAPMKNGRPGLNLWIIFVLAMLKLGLNCDYDRLQELANQHNTIRQMLGIGTFDKIHFELKTIQNNVRLFTPKVLEEINKVVIDFGHKVISKKKIYMQNVTPL